MSLPFGFEKNALPLYLQEQVERELEDGEQLVWTGQPVPKYFTTHSTGAFLFAIPWTAFAIFWICGASGFKIPDFSGPQSLFPLFGVPFVLIGFWLLSTPLGMYRNMKRTAYAITDHRAIIFAGGTFSTTVRSFEPDELTDLTRKERRNGFGDIYFYGPPSFSAAQQRGPSAVYDLGFLNLPNVREVERLLRDLARSVPETA